MRYFPVMLDLSGRFVVIAGTGALALGKARLLLKTEAEIRVYGPPAPAFAVLASRGGRLCTADGLPGADELKGAALFLAATGDRDTDRRLCRLARAAGIPAGAVDNPGESDFVMPALVDRDPVIVAIHGGGMAPVLARRLRMQIEALLSPALGTLARFAGRIRGSVRERFPSHGERRRFWEGFLAPGADAAAARGEPALSAWYGRQLARGPGDRACGLVSLAGAGPGDPELLTLKVRRRLYSADAVIHDGLVDPRILELARRDAQLVRVAKAPGGPSWRQQDITGLMISLARQGLDVVRLKSGDPGIFGRLDEEISALEAAGIPLEILPGVSAAVAAAAAAGHSLTARGRNAMVAFLTGHDTEGLAEHEWRALVRPGAVFAVYMGVQAARFIQGRLFLHGAPGDMPVTIAASVSRPDEVIRVTCLGDLPAAVAEVGRPAVLLFGLAARNVAGRDGMAPAQMQATGPVPQTPVPQARIPAGAEQP